MLPVSVDSASLSSLEVAQTANGQFRCWKDGDVSHLISGRGFLLASRPLAEEISRLCPTGLQIKQIQLLAAPAGISESYYSELLILHEVTPTNIDLIGAICHQVWHFRNEHLFVSPKLAATLSSGPLGPALMFSDGFSRFAGSEVLP